MRPPRLHRLLLACLLHPHDRACALGDLDEEFEARVVRDGVAAARRWYRQQTRRSIVPALGERLRPRVGRGQRSTLARRTWALAAELRWAWRGVRGRRWASLFQVGLVAVTLTAVALVFSVTDAFVFRPAPYPNAHRLVVLQSAKWGITDYISPPEILAWREHRDLFATVQAYDAAGWTFVTLDGVVDRFGSAAVTPGLFEALGVVPKWGRPFVAGDERPDAPPRMIISESLARRRFTDPAAAVGQPLETNAGPVEIVGVMPADFRFPSATEQVWRPLSPDGLVTETSVRNIRNLALAAVDVPLATVIGGVAARAPAVADALGPRLASVSLTAVALTDVRRDARSRLFTMLFGAAGCLLLIGCLNVAGLELAGAVGRSQVFAIQAALGATRATLVRTALVEGLILTGTGAILAIGTVPMLASVLTTWLPGPLRNPLINPIDIDARVIGVALAAFTLTWLITAAPVVRRVCRPHIVDVLRRDRRTATMSRRDAALRHVLMAGQVALTVLLLVGALLFVRTYAAQLGADKGFDSDGLATVEILRPNQALRPAEELGQELLARLQALPAVISVARVSSIPPSNSAGIGGPLTVIGREGAPGPDVMLASYSVDLNYFETIGIRIVRGRGLTPSDPPGQVVVDQAFVDAYWPDGDALAAGFKVGSAGFGGAYEFEIVGIAEHVRGERTRTVTGDPVFAVYAAISSNYSPLTFVMRLRDDTHLAAIAAAARAAAPGTVVRLDTVDARYARLYGDTMVAAAVTSGFGVLALLLATAGIYGVLMFVVLGRTREIGIRVALGATSTQVHRLIMVPLTLFVGIGIAAGALAARAASLLIEGYLVGVTSTDPLTYLSVMTLVAVTAVAAAWRPARRAGRTDPAITLRAE